MTVSTFVLLVVAGIGAGLVGYLVGLASLVSYPVLLAVGLPPVAANVTNTLALVGAGLGASARAGRQFAARGIRKTAVEVVIALIGGLLGGWLLVATGETSFSSIVPWLVLSAGILLLVSPHLTKARAFTSVPRAVYYLALLLVCIYGGYFGAGSGVIYLAVAVLLSGMDFSSSILVKSILLALSNLTAALLFIFTAPVHWPAAIALGIGCTIGGWLGPSVQRVIPDNVLRIIVAISSFGLSIWLWLHR